MERHSFGQSLFLLLAVVLQLHRLVLASSSAINCTLGRDEQTPVHAGQVMNLRRGEELIVNCQGDPRNYSSLTLEYEGTHDVLKKNKTTLVYSWYNQIESDGAIEVWGFEGDQAFQLIAFTVKAHDLDALLEDLDALLEDLTTSSVNGDGSANAILQNRSSNDEETTDTGSESTTSDTAVQDTPLYIVVAVLGIFILIVAALLLALVVMVKSRCKECKVSKMEKGQNEHELGQAPPPEEGAGREDKDVDTSVLNTSSTPLQTDSGTK